MRIAFVFSGIGTQWEGMAAGLLETDAIFRNAIIEVDALFSPLRQWSLLDLLSGRRTEVSLANPTIAHPAIFTVQYALSRCLLHRGLKPAATIGHSAGEVAAAVCAEALTLPDAVRLVAAHCELIDAVQPGAMLHAAIAPQAVAARIANLSMKLEIAAINAPQAVVLAGQPNAIAAFATQLTEDGIENRLLSIQVPFHTRTIEPHLEIFRDRIKDIHPHAPIIPFYSSLHGGLSQTNDFSADYWLRHIREPVRFLDAANELLKDKLDGCIEISPHPALLQHLAAAAAEQGSEISLDATLQRGVPIPIWPHQQTAREANSIASTFTPSNSVSVAHALQETIAATLGIDFVLEETGHLKWSELGCTSLQITQIMAKLSAQLDKRLSVTLPYRHPTPAQLLTALSEPTHGNTAPSFAKTTTHDAPIGITGMACRFPGGANNPDALWQLLASGTDPISEIPAERWQTDAFYDPDRQAKGKSVSRWGGFIEQDPRDFDARFFRMTPREASALDPQQRLLLEVTWEALENAGLSVPSLKGKRVGVYIGLSTDDYKNSTLYVDDLDTVDPYVGAGAMSCTAAGRLSYFFGWEGPNLALDTACSSSLVALHLARQALQSGECDVAVVGGANALLTPHLYVYFSKAGIMSPTGRCHVFDDSADGYVRAEGCGMLVLEREADAIGTGRRIRARVLASAINQDGASTGFSAPNGAAQLNVLRQAWEQAGITAADLSYVEAHGTGTPIGDPIELEALAEAVTPQRTPQDPLSIGSLKSNLGHLEAAAGVAAVIKTVLALEHGELPANLHFSKPNSRIDWDQLPLRITDKHCTLPERNDRRIAGISSFGFSGTNAHAVLEQVRPSLSTIPPRSVQVLSLSAPDQTTLQTLAKQYAQRIGKINRAALADLACTTHLTRPALTSRVALAATDPAEMSALLMQWAENPTEANSERIFTSDAENDVGPLVFAFTGQGCQYAGMGRSLFHSEPVFRAVLERCELAFKHHTDRSLLDLMLNPNTDTAQLDATDIAQPAIFAIQCGIVALLASWGIRPDQVIGHSVGEFAAAVAANVLDLEEALMLVAERGRLMASLPPGGAMAAVRVDEQTAVNAIGEQRDLVALAAINGPRSVVLSGDASALDIVLTRLGVPGARARRLSVSHAYHSPLMTPAAEAFSKLTSPHFRPSQIPLISSVDGNDLSNDCVDMRYWAKQIMSPVRFDHALTVLESKGCRTFVEIGPATVLTQMGRERGNSAALRWIPTQQRQSNNDLSIANALAALAALGQEIDWAKYDDPASRRHTDLPPYPFQRRRHWREINLPRATAGRTPLPEDAPYPWLNHYALQRLLATLQLAGLIKNRGVDQARQKQKTSATPLHIQKQFESCVLLLIDAELVTKTNDAIAITPVGEKALIELPRLDLEKDRFLAAHPSLSNCFRLLDECLDRYPDIIAGHIDPLQLLFPGGSLDRVESVYANNEVQDLYNRQVAETVSRWYQTCLSAKPQQVLRILEVGAGTGATTAAILAALPADAMIDYCFTDIGPAFLARAKQRFGHAKQVRFALLNIEQHPQAQGFNANTVDLVIANNVLHATADIDVTLAHVHWLAATDGTLVLNEQTALQPFIHLIFGLTSGWWRFADKPRQEAQSPILPRQTWMQALQQSGFDVRPDTFDTTAGQTIFIADRQYGTHNIAAVLSNANTQESYMHRDAHVSSSAPGIAASSVLSSIRNMIADLTGMTDDEIDADTALIDLGLDSLMMVQLKSLLANRLDLEVSIVDLYGDMDTLTKLAQAAPTGSLSPAGESVAKGAKPVGVRASEIVSNNHINQEPQTPRVASSQHAHSSAPATALTPNPPAGDGIPLTASGLTQQSDLAQLMALQLNTVSRIISEQNALLSRAPATIQKTEPAPTISANIPTSSATASEARPNIPNFRSLKLDDDALKPQQKTFVTDLAQRYAARTPSSKALADRTRHTLADWKNTLSFRYTLKEMMYPIVAATSSGSHFIDLDNNDFLDVTMGCGIALLGHSPACVTKAVHAQVDAHFAIGPQTHLAAEVAERFSRITGMERVTFCNTGAEAVMMAVRMARAVTGRNKVVIFNGAYHGTWDGVLGVEHEGHVWPIAAGIPQGMVNDLLILNYGTDEALATIRERAHELAAVLVEPVQSRRPGLQPAAFLKEIRTITQNAGCALIFDEMITGFRILPGGAQAYYGIQADLATYGKIVGGGLPLSAVAGNARFMDAVDGGDWQYGDDSRPNGDVIYFGGTYVKHPLALAAARAALDEIERIGTAGYEDLNRRSARMAKTLNAWFAAESVPLTMANFGSLFRIDGLGRYSALMQPIELDLFFLLLNLRSIYVWERRICFLSFAHTDEEVDRFIACVKEAVQELRAGGFDFRSAENRKVDQHASNGPVTLTSPYSEKNIGWATAAQRRMYALAEIEGPSVVYNVPLAIRLQGPLDITKLEQSLHALVKRHPALRTRFAIDEDTLMQQVELNVPFAIEHIVCAADKVSERLAAFVRPFDLATAPLFRAGLLRIAPDHHVLIMDAHHIVVDGLSLNLLAQELMAGYAGKALPEITVGLIDYASTEAAYLASDACRRDSEYWSSQFSSIPEPLQLPLDHPRPLQRRHGGADLLAVLDEHATTRLKAAARTQKMSTFPLLLTLYAALLHRISSQDDIVIGLPVGGRTDPRFRNTVGMLAATLPLRFIAMPQETLGTCARAYQKMFLNALGHQNYPLEALIAGLDLPRDTSRNPLFDTMFIYEDGNDRVYKMSDLECTPADVSRHAAMFDFSMEIIEAEGKLTLRCEYDVDLFSTATAQEILATYIRLLEQAPDMLERPIADLKLVDEQQRALLLSWGDGGTTSSQSTVLEMFDKQLVRTPDAVALISESETLTYNELDRRANRLAHTLLRNGPLPPDTPVALVSHRDAGLVIGLLAILRAGAAYVPVDPEFPKERIRLMCEASGCKHLLVSPDLASILPALPNARVLHLNEFDANASDISPACTITADNLAYVIFTSGSTGTPKGVMLRHRNAAAFFACLPEAFGFSAGDRILAVTTVSFDIAALELIGPLTCGMTVVLATSTQAKDSTQLLNLIEEERVTVMQMTPTRLRMLLDATVDPMRSATPTILPGIRTLLIGGEALPSSLAKELLAHKHIRAFNVYGPTETTIWSTSWPIKEGPISLGDALPGDQLFVLSKQHRLQSPGAVGEIAIAGAGVARGYVNDPARTAERFITLAGVDGPVYLTGDLGRWRTDGTLEFLGRRDAQIKIRGMRIEIGEVEHHLRQLADVRDAAAAIRQNRSGEAEIVAYLVGPKNNIDAAVLRATLAENLPMAMIPSRFMVLPALPQTPNGKTDRRALPDPEPLAPKGPARKPNGPVETALTRILSEVLGHTIGPDDDFFLEGGESIRALRLAGKIRAEGLAFELRDLFRWPTPAALAANLKPLQQEKHKEQTVGELSGLSDAELAELIA